MQQIVRLTQLSQSPQDWTKKSIRQHGQHHWQNYLDLFLMPIVLICFVSMWQAVVWWGDYPTFILPAPSDVITTFKYSLSDGTLWQHIQVTLLEILAGLSLGLTMAVIFGYILAKNQLLEKLISPYLVALQAVPIVAIAPLLIIWLGAGYLSKILVCALIVFFPVLISTIVGLRSVEPNLRDLMRSLQASRWQMFYLLEVPAALPVLLGGLKISVTLSVIGAVVGEFVGANQGLGFLINQAKGLFNTPLVFVAILTLVMITLTLYGLVALLEARLLRWKA